MVTKTKRKTSRQQRERRGFWFPVLILCLLVLGGAFWAYKSGLFNKLSNDKKDEEIVADTKNINTAELDNNVENKSAESKETDYGSSFKNQAEAASKEQEVAKNEAGLKIAEVYVANAGVDTQNGQVYASGVITNVVNNTGVCTYTFTNGSDTITETSEVLPSPKETICANVNLDKNRFTSGSWSVTLNFKSDYAEGTSDATTFTIQ
jgi:nitrogen fixation-related uncharacterized protein